MLCHVRSCSRPVPLQVALELAGAFKLPSKKASQRASSPLPAGTAALDLRPGEGKD